MRSRRSWGVAIGAALATLTAVRAAAQTTTRPMELSVGVSLFGRTRFPEVAVTEAAPGGLRRTVFRMSTVLDPSVGAAVHVAVPVTAAIAAESTLSWNRTSMSTHVREDIEGAPDTTASEFVTQFLVEGGVMIGRWQRDALRWQPFVSAGGGYLRQLNEGQTLVETGQSLYAGGGAHYSLKHGGTGWIKSSGLRLDLRLTVFRGGVALDDGSHAAPSGGAAVFVRF